MNKQTLLEMNKHILHKIEDLAIFYKMEDINESSFSDWNARDVIGHLNTWVDFLNNKLKSFKKENQFKDLEQDEIEKYNNENYEKNKNKILNDVLNEARIIFGNFKNSLELFTEDELFSKDYRTGFDVELWRYMSMDLITHPINHILYQYLKRRNYEKFILESEDVKKYCGRYSDENDTIYYFKDLFKNEEEKKIILKDISEKYKDNKLIEEIIKINK
ncbi:hypothetical protein PilKf_01013 [Pillotina sp. SPG140]|jgi:hypothetical protein